MARKQQKGKRPLGARLIAPGHNREEEEEMGKRKGLKGAKDRARLFNHAAKGTIALARDKDTTPGSLVGKIARTAPFDPQLMVPQVPGSDPAIRELGRVIRGLDAPLPGIDGDRVADQIARIGQHGSLADKRQLIRESTPDLLNVSGQERVTHMDTLARALGLTIQAVAFEMTDCCTELAREKARRDLVEYVELDRDRVAAFLLDPRNDLADTGPDTGQLVPDRLVQIHSPLLDRMRDRLAGMSPPDAAIAAIIAIHAEIGPARTKDDAIAALYYAGQVLRAVPDPDWGPHLDALSRGIGIRRDKIAEDIRRLQRDASLREYDRRPTLARNPATNKPTHWRDALDSLTLIGNYWREQESYGTHVVPLLAYGWGWSTTDRTAEELATERGLYGQAGIADAVAATKRLIARGLAEALPCYVAPPIVDLLEEAALTIPAATLTADMLPARSGVFWFGRAIEWRTHADPDEIDRFVFSAGDMRGGVENAEKLGHVGLGTPTPEQLAALDAAGTIDTNPALRAIAWHPVVGPTATNQTPEERALFACYFDHRPPDGLPLEMFDFSCEVSFTIGYGMPLNRADDGLDIPSGAQFILDLLATTLRFLHQTILRPETRSVENKGARRRLEKQLGRTPPPVQIIRLREYADDDQGALADAPATGRNYSCRWLVRGHWRQQACGPKRTHRRPLYIQPHVKGPQDKELVVREKLVTVSR